ncbi:MAG: hypothetical protein U1F36_23545 [Planctomycetota bacterium]
MADSASRPGDPDPPSDPTILDVRRMIEEILQIASAEAKRQLRTPMGAKERASDLAQSVVRAMLEKDGKLEFRGDAALRGLIKTMVVARLAQKRRHQLAQKRDDRRNAATPSELGDAAPLAEGASPASIVVWREMVARADGEIAKLSERERRVMELGTAGRTAAEIAAAEGITEASAQKILWRVRQALGQRVFGWEDG